MVSLLDVSLLKALGLAPPPLLPRDLSWSNMSCCHESSVFLACWGLCRW